MHVYVLVYLYTHFTVKINSSVLFCSVLLRPTLNPLQPTQDRLLNDKRAQQLIFVVQKYDARRQAEPG